MNYHIITCYPTGRRARDLTRAIDKRIARVAWPSRDSVHAGIRYSGIAWFHLCESYPDMSGNARF